MSTFFLGVLCGERLGESATSKEIATAANAAVYAMLPGRHPGSGGHAGRRAYQRQQAIAGCGTEELAPGINHFGRKSHNALLEL